MLEKTQMRALPLVNTTVDYAPVLPACCNACRVCVSSNLLGIVTGGALGLAAAISRLARKFAKPS